MRILFPFAALWTVPSSYPHHGTFSHCLPATIWLDSCIQIFWDKVGKVHIYSSLALWVVVETGSCLLMNIFIKLYYSHKHKTNSTNNNHNLHYLTTLMLCMTRMKNKSIRVNNKEYWKKSCGRKYTTQMIQHFGVCLRWERGANGAMMKPPDGITPSIPIFKRNPS